MSRVLRTARLGLPNRLDQIQFDQNPVWLEKRSRG
jgi:hypothetical protein